MRRDLNFIRKLVLMVEDEPARWPSKLALEGYSEFHVGYHAHLLVKAGLAEGIDTTPFVGEGPRAFITSLTWPGHEFAELVRDEDRWNQAISTITNEAQAMTFEALKGLLVNLPKIGRKPAPSQVDARHSSTREAANLKVRARPGPTPDPHSAQCVLQIIESVAPLGDWKAKLEDVCERLDADGIPFPSTWPKRDLRPKGWVDAATLERHLAIKAIVYRLKNAKK